MIGLPAFIESETVDFKAFTQISGWGFRMPRRIFERELTAKGIFEERLQEYTEVLLLAVGQSCFCIRMHDQVERCALWLLSVHDRAPRAKLVVTHEFLAQLLGVRRATVSAAVKELKSRNAIEGGRGSVRILDPDSLRAMACDCYSSVRSEFAALKRKWEKSS
ncbi:MAG: Crp/Fnr family transcriptional regulator [Acidobacteria bacterium]|nr:Crp/Fnr family transcriptional regulator [Acidobacteriota bacterium]